MYNDNNDNGNNYNNDNNDNYNNDNYNNDNGNNGVKYNNDIKLEYRKIHSSRIPSYSVVMDRI